MNRLIREQRIEKRISKRQRFYQSGGQNGRESKTLVGGMLSGAHNNLRPLLATRVSPSTSPITILSSRARVNRYYHTSRMRRVASTWAFVLESICAKILNTDICYLAACFVAILFLSFALKAESAMVNFTLQPAIFRLPDIQSAHLPTYVHRQPVKIEDYDQTLRDYASLETNTYVVQNGQTLSELSEIHNVSMSTLISFNEISNARSLLAGSSYTVPDREGILYTVERNDRIESVADRYGVTVNALLDINNLESAALESGQVLFVPGASLSDFDLRLSLGELFANPLYGRRTSGYGYRNDPFTGLRRFHYGVDVAAPTGSAIIAAMEGRVSYIGEQSRGYGKYVIIRHPGGFQSLYGHLNGFNVSTGQSVARGQTIGWVGNTGRSTGPHLHFSIIKDGRFVNPDFYLY